MAATNDGDGPDAGAWELFDSTLGRVIAGPFPSQSEGNTAKAYAAGSHKFTVRKVRNGDKA